MTKEEQFANELIGYIFAYPDDDYMTMECLCRKLHKYGLIEKKDGEWTTDFIERKGEPQYDFSEYADRLWRIAYERGYEIGKEQEHRWWSTFCANCKDIKDELQTEREGE